MTIPLAAIKHLFGVAQNRCAFPGCGVPLIEDSGTITGQVCHIHAASKNGPRYNASQTQEERDGFANLVVLCPRHHTIVDAEVATYPAEKLKAFKEQHERGAIAEITPAIAKVAQVIYERQAGVVIKNNSGQVAINSPGAVLAGNLTIKTTKSKVVVAPSDGSIAANVEKRGYVAYLIKRYQDCQKADESKPDRRKYMIIYSAIQKEFGNKWEFVPEARFDELVAFLKMRIDRTILGRLQKSKGSPIYHEFELHGKRPTEDD